MDIILHKESEEDFVANLLKLGSHKGNKDSYTYLFCFF